MLLDARVIGGTHGEPALQAAVCVIGGGVAGITVALALGRAGVDVLLLESGGLTSEAATDHLSRAATTTTPGLPLHEHARGRFLGGSSNLWGGWCRPLEREDFEARSWVPGSGWPIAYDEMLPYYRRSHDVLDLGPDNYDPTFWIGSIDDPRVRRIPFADDDVQDSFTQFSGRHRLGARHREELVSSRRVRLVLHANVTELVTDPQARRVTGVEVRTLSGARFTVAARQVVLATGGIENARLLLASDRMSPQGLGNDHDLVGRHFMDHPRLRIGKVTVRGPLRDNLLYDLSTHDRTPGLTAHGTSVAAHFVLNPRVVEEEQLLASRAWLRTSVVAAESHGVQALRRLRMGVAQRGGWQPDHAELAAAAVRDPFRVAAYMVGRTLNTAGRRTSIEVIAESTPDPDSRVTLAEARDALGMRKVRVAWRLGDEVGRTLHRTATLVGAALERAGAADVTIPALRDDWREHATSTWHHMGTTRMALSPEAGVVDPSGRVHGVENLYVAGSSVFPSVGANFPTMTLTALALRLADHLVALERPVELGHPDLAAPVEAPPWPAVAPVHKAAKRPQPH
ncbi:MAG: family oxidoreductase [Nocardioidaceae bacterium]|nr:family oxidoreductase [Nocardioidaceae bacterium]